MSVSRYLATGKDTRARETENMPVEHLARSARFSEQVGKFSNPELKPHFRAFPASETENDYLHKLMKIG
jgi:hypothetical protein